MTASWAVMTWMSSVLIRANISVSSITFGSLRLLHTNLVAILRLGLYLRIWHSGLSTNRDYRTSRLMFLRLEGEVFVRDGSSSFGPLIGIDLCRGFGFVTGSSEKYSFNLLGWLPHSHGWHQWWRVFATDMTLRTPIVPILLVSTVQTRLLRDRQVR